MLMTMTSTTPNLGRGMRRLRPRQKKMMRPAAEAKIEAEAEKKIVKSIVSPDFLDSLEIVTKATTNIELSNRISRKRAKAGQMMIRAENLNSIPNI